ncbi:dimethylallyl tryptophan synthase, putative [Aspergillus udagawae]|uniref:Dimethylallyl tryptophan synthase, putative n=1 Tax=Aspergillus udagawae TaxID=91492 RepID=A0ABQ1AI89_9EURO|nr:dimethylallyl tryptophan synthase, putative [Aspergillus udagawae]
MTTHPQNHDLPMGSAMKAAPFEALDLVFHFEDQAQRQWWKQAGPVLGQHLLLANYDINKQYQYLCFFGHHIIPILGPGPGSGYDYHPLEISQNFQRSGSTIRLGFQPRAYSSCVSPQDPFGELSTEEAMARLGQVTGVELDLQPYHLLASQLNLTKKEEKEMLQPTCYNSLSPSFKTQGLLAVELPRTGNITLKGYWFLSAKSMVTKTPISELSFQAFRNIDAGKDLLIPALRPIEEYFAEMKMKPANPATPQTTEFATVACDHVDMSRTRFKLYLYECLWKYDRLADIYTLGGRLKNAPGIAEGLELLREIWSILQIPEGYHFASLQNSLLRKSTNAESCGEASKSASEEREFFDDQALIFNFEIRPGERWPQPKVYFPLAYLTDSKAADAVVALFEKLGWKEEARRYKDNLKTY